VTVEVEHRAWQPPDLVGRELDVPASTVDEWRRFLAAYLADPDLHASPVPRGAVLWFLRVASPYDQQHILKSADHHVEAVVARRYTDPGVWSAPTDRVMRGDEWQVLATDRWDITAVAALDPGTVTVTLARRRP
jgi:hypothetical protein